MMFNLRVGFENTCINGIDSLGAINEKLKKIGFYTEEYPNFVIAHNDGLVSINNENYGHNLRFVKINGVLEVFSLTGFMPVPPSKV